MVNNGKYVKGVLYALCLLFICFTVEADAAERDTPSKSKAPKFELASDEELEKNLKPFRKARTDKIKEVLNIEGVVLVRLLRSLWAYDEAVMEYERFQALIFIEKQGLKHKSIESMAKVDKAYGKRSEEARRKLISAERRHIADAERDLSREQLQKYYPIIMRYKDGFKGIIFSRE